MDQQLAKQVQEIENRGVLTKLPKALLENLLPEERRILEVKYQAPAFAAMEPEDVDLWADALLLKIHAITGWVVPERTMLTVFSDQFRKKIAESYANTNPEEIEFAFRNYGTVVEDWGKQMNLNMIDKVMIPYLARRAELSKVEEQKAPNFKLPAPVEDLSEKSMMDWAREVRHRILTGITSIPFMAPMLYDKLDALGKIVLTKEEKKAYMEKAVNYRQGQLVKLVEDDNSFVNRKTINDFMLMKEVRIFTGEEWENLKILAKKIALYEFLQSEWQ